MSNEIVVWNFEEEAVRTLTGLDGEQRWVATDVCRAIGIKSPENAYVRLDDDEKGIHPVDTPGGPQEMVTVNESGLYNLMLKSQKPQAKRFKKWITSEVLPTIRKTGEYRIGPPEDHIVAALRCALESRRAQLALEQAQLALESKNQKLDAAVKVVEQRVDVIDHRSEELIQAVYGDTQMVAIVGYCARHKISITEEQSARVGGALTRWCKDRGINYGSKTAHNERWGGVNIYPIEVLDEWRAGKIPVKGIRIENDRIIDTRFRTVG